MAPNTCCSLFPICRFVYTYTHNSKTKGCIWTFYLSMTALLLEISILWVRAVWEIQTASIGPKHGSQPLSNTTFCVLTLITRKLQAVYRHSTYRMTPPLWAMSNICVRAEREMQLASYGSKHASQSLSNKPFVCTYTHKSTIIGHMWTLCMSNDCCTIKNIPWVV